MHDYRGFCLDWSWRTATIWQMATGPSIQNRGDGDVFTPRRAGGGRG